MKPFYKYLIIALILGIVAWIVYFVLSRNAEQPQEVIPIDATTTEQIGVPTDTGDNTTTTEQIDVPTDTGDPESGESVKTSFSKIEKISDVPVRFFWYYRENNRIFYVTENGEIKKVIDGKSETLQLNSLENVSVVRPNRGGSSVLLKFTNNSNTIWGIFSSMDEKITPLSSSIIDAVWGFNNKDVVASWDQGGKTSIVSLSSIKNFSDVSIILPEISLFDVDLIGQSDDELLFVEKFGNEYATSIWQYNIKTKLFSTIRKGLLDFSLNPTASAYFFTSKADGFVIANSLLERIMPTIQKTLPEKCSSVLTTAFCFVPQTEISLFNWYTNSSFSNDSLYIYNLDAEAEDQINLTGIAKNPIDAKDIIPTMSSLYFINKYDNFIYALN